LRVPLEEEIGLLIDEEGNPEGAMPNAPVVFLDLVRSDN
jgi:hypothetical protein